jgi:hypothetical protein
MKMINKLWTLTKFHISCYEQPFLLISTSNICDLEDTLTSNRIRQHGQVTGNEWRGLAAKQPKWSGNIQGIIKRCIFAKTVWFGLLGAMGTQNMQSSPLCTNCMHSVHKYILHSHIMTLTTNSFTMLSTMYSMEMRAAKISSVKRVNSFTKTLPSKQTTTRPIIPSQRPIYTRTVRKSSPFVKQNWKKCTA